MHDAQQRQHHQGTAAEVATTALGCRGTSHQHDRDHDERHRHDDRRRADDRADQRLDEGADGSGGTEPDTGCEQQTQREKAQRHAVPAMTVTLPP